MGSPSASRSSRSAPLPYAQEGSCPSYAHAHAHVLCSEVGQLHALGIPTRTFRSGTEVLPQRPSRAQRSAPLRLFVETAKELLVRKV